MKDLEKVYNPLNVENKIYQFWLDNEYFKAKVDGNKTPYTIMMPPPNITGKLHMGHALDNTLQDILIRYKRMCGFSALWLPGTDHASIATELKIVEELEKEGITKSSISREEFLKRAWQWKEEYGSNITSQLKKLGSSCDWSRERFTLDEGCSDAVKTVFVNLYNKGLIYKGKRMVNWCPDCLTSISDAEVEFEEKDGALYHIKYQVVGTEDFLIIATTRPETLLGDTAVCVNPNDERYKHLIGKELKIPLINRNVPIIADEYVDMDFGTGVLKVTPAHDPNDYEIALRHDLPIINIMHDDASINDNGEHYSGLDRYDARKKIVSDLKEKNFLHKIEDRPHNVGTCYRCNTVIEPKISEQWFVKMNSIAKPANDVVKYNKIKFYPERFSKIYFHWMDNVKDWCISRQLWWGHQIPAFYCNDCGEITVTKETENISCFKCNSKNVYQDSDTLDTWFSSALWPFSTLGWPEKTEDLKYFYPTDTLVTGYDIIFFWVARMIFSGIEHMEKIPFKNVFIHGIVRDENGKKMSKSLGNGIDPIEIIDEYGADALRFTLANGNSPGNDMRFSKDKILNSRNFANKIWNAARFIMMNIDDNTKPVIPEKLNIEDKWILTLLNKLILDVTNHFDKFEIGLIATKVYDFFWNTFCDWYIEVVKKRLNNKDKDAQSIILYVFKDMLKILHPIMPFLTEEIFLSLPNSEKSIMISDFPKYNNSLIFENDSLNFGYIMESITAIRNIRSQMTVPNSKKTDIYIQTENKNLYLENKDIFISLAFCNNVYIDNKFEIENTVECVSSNCKIFIKLDELIDKEKELSRLNKEKEKLLKEIDLVNSKLNNEGFVKKAPIQLIEKEKEKEVLFKQKLNNILDSIEKLK